MRNNFAQFILIAFLTVGYSISAEASYSEIEKFAKIRTTKLPSSMTPFYDDKNQPLTFETWEGQLIVVYMWASWCNACIPDLLQLDQLAKAMHKAQIQLVPISTDYKRLCVRLI